MNVGVCVDRSEEEKMKRNRFVIDQNPHQILYTLPVFKMCMCVGGCKFDDKINPSSTR